MSRKRRKKTTAPLVKGLRAPPDRPEQGNDTVDGDQYDFTTQLVLGRLRQPEAIYLGLRRSGKRGLMLSKKLGLDQTQTLIRSLQQFAFTLWPREMFPKNRDVRDDRAVDVLEDVALEIRECADCDRTAENEGVVCPHHLDQIAIAVQESRAQLLRWRFPYKPDSDPPGSPTDTTSVPPPILL